MSFERGETHRERVVVEYFLGLCIKCGVKIIWLSILKAKGNE